MDDHFDNDLPSDIYKDVIRNVQPTKTPKGDPRLKWALEIVNPDYK